MQQALALARMGEGLASPNPMVGCLIVDDNQQIIGRGWHEFNHRDHAEVVALRESGERARGATAYVTLEPCAHTGRTGPCAEALVRAGVARVVCAMQDVNPLVRGRGFEMLRRAGIAVEVGLCGEDARRLNAAFTRHMRESLPLVTLKNALSLDGRIAPAPAHRHAGVNYLSSPETLAEVHRLRHAADAILIGVDTALADDPLLSDRSSRERARPLLLVFHSSINVDKQKALIERGVEVIPVSPDAQGHCSLSEVMRHLGERRVLGALVEGGSRLNRAMLEQDVADRMMLFYSPRILGADAPPLIAGDALAELPQPIHSHVFQFGADVCLELWLRDVYA